MKIELYKFPDTIDDGMQYSHHWETMEFLNRIAEGLNVLLAELPKCTCPTNEQHKTLTETLMETGQYGSTGWCDKHGRWEIINPKIKWMGVKDPK